jgi:hypothetical protein
VARVGGRLPDAVKPDEIATLSLYNALATLPKNGTDSGQKLQVSLVDFLGKQERPTGEEEVPLIRVLFFDQFEELFTFYSEDYHRKREAFFEQVVAALEGDPLLRVVFVIREDYLAQLDSFVHLLPDKLRTRYRLEKLKKEQALLAVKGPLKDTSRSFHEGVAEELVEGLLKVRVQDPTGLTMDVTGEYVEPVQLQIVCGSLWESLPPGIEKITSEHLKTFGDVDEILKAFYEDAVKTATKETDADEEAIRSWFTTEKLFAVGLPPN